MRNLKKVLSMALAVVMMLGMLTVASAADTTAKKTSANLADFGSVTNKEAVSLLVDLGIIAGIEKDGKFNFEPTTGIDRASYSKMVYYILQGDASADSYKGGSTLKDVKGHWAEGFINYLSSVKIVAGDDKAMFNAGAKVTVVQAAKMLLVALGNNALDRGYEQDTNWSLNIMRDAQSAGLLASVTQTATQELTRDNAAQMIYNALFAFTKEAVYGRDSGERYVADYKIHKSTLGLEVYGLVKVTMNVGGYASSAFTATAGAIAPAGTDAGTVASDATNKTIADLKFSGELVGANAAVYAKVAYSTASGSLVYNTFTKLYSAAPVAASTAILATTYKNMTGAAFTNATTKGDVAFVAEVDTDATTSYYLNGVGGLASTPANKTNAIAGMVAGAKTEFIDTDSDNKAEVVKVTKKTVGFVTGDVATKTVTDVLNVKIPGVTGFTGYVAASTAAGYENLKKDDVVLYVSVGGVTYFEKAEMVEGKATSMTSASKLMIDGTGYGQSGLAKDSAWGGVLYTTSAANYTNTYKYYLDNGKNIFWADLVNEVASSNYAVVIGTQYTASTLDSASAAKAKLLFVDGTTEVVTVAKVDGADATGITTITGLTDETFVTYSVSDGKYSLTNVAALASGTGEVGTPLVHASLTANKITHTTALLGTGINANANTVFIITTGAGTNAKTEVFTGIANVPTITMDTAGGAGLGSAFIVMKDNFAQYVYVNHAIKAGAAGDLVYFPTNTYVSYPAADGIAAYKLVTAYVNGESKEIKLVDTFNLSAVKGMMFEVTARDGNDIITNVTGTVGTPTNLLGSEIAAAHMTAASGGVAVISGSATPAKNGTFNYDADTQVFFINSDKELSTGSIAANATYLVLNAKVTDGHLDIVYIVEV